MDSIADIIKKSLDWLQIAVNEHQQWPFIAPLLETNRLHLQVIKNHEQLLKAVKDECDFLDMEDGNDSCMCGVGDAYEAGFLILAENKNNWPSETDFGNQITATLKEYGFEGVYSFVAFHPNEVSQKGLTANPYWMVMIY